MQRKHKKFYKSFQYSIKHIYKTGSFRGISETASLLGTTEFMGGSQKVKKTS